ncbi:MAG: methylenetetrahydrofolate reductase [Candidatus Omnitrophica bacterium]|nr:methylenetetrahydrofolate reductase [Candidatus Omnitrophota bacterium]
MSFEEALKTKKFLVTTELGPPKGTDLTDLLEDAERIRGRVDGMNVTDCQGSVLKASSIAVCVKLLEKGLEPILQVSCAGRNRLALQSDLLGASILGVRNVLVLTGDPPHIGDHPEAKPVFDLDSITLMKIIRGFGEGEGKDMMGNVLKGKARWCIAAAANPGAKDLKVEFEKTKAKVEAGASFFQTQAVFEPDLFRHFMELIAPLKVTLLCGIIQLKSVKMAEHLNKIPGIHVPDPLMEEIDKAEDKRKKSIEITARLVRAVKPYCRGVHIMCIGGLRDLPAILDEAGL